MGDQSAQCLPPSSNDVVLKTRGYLAADFPVHVVVLTSRPRTAVATNGAYTRVRKYLESLVGKSDRDADADEFLRLSEISGGNSQNWKFDRQEIHERT